MEWTVEFFDADGEDRGGMTTSSAASVAVPTSPGLADHYFRSKR
jgi:hypothetical protein